MSGLAILAPLLFLSGIVVAQISAPDCTASGWQWTFNSLGQNPCLVAAYLLATCSGGTWNLLPLDPGSWYTVYVEFATLCNCNTVTYSLKGACGACQGDTWTTWSGFSFNCTKTMPVSTFPNPIPSGIRVPQWALLDVTLENNWNPKKSFAVSDSPDLTPGMEIPPLPSSTRPSPTTPTTPSTTPTTPSPTPTTPSPTPTTPSPTPTTPSQTSTQSSSSNAGAIAGGAIAGGIAGGVAAIAVAGLAIFFWLRRKRPQAPSATLVVDGAPQPLMGEVRPDDGTHGPSSMPGTPASPVMLYDPNDPTTFSGFQGAGQVHTEVPVTPYSRNTLTNIKASPPPEYHSLPTV